jgi:hypothetical protein
MSVRTLTTGLASSLRVTEGALRRPSAGVSGSGFSEEGIAI